jgi:hypothetical protein
MRLGVLLAVAHGVHTIAKRESGQVDWGAFFAGGVEILKAAGSDTLFALAAGVVGALVAIGIASKTRHEVKVERGQSVQSRDRRPRPDP